METVTDPAGRTRWTLSDPHRKVLSHLRSFHSLSDDDLSGARQFDSYGTGVLCTPPGNQLAN